MYLFDLSMSNMKSEALTQELSKRKVFLTRWLPTASILVVIGGEFTATNSNTIAFIAFLESVLSFEHFF